MYEGDTRPSPSTTSLTLRAAISPTQSPARKLSMTARRVLSLCLSLAMTESSRLPSAPVKTLACCIPKTSSNLAIHQKTLYFLTCRKSIGR